MKKIAKLTRNPANEDILHETFDELKEASADYKNTFTDDEISNVRDILSRFIKDARA